MIALRTIVICHLLSHTVLSETGNIALNKPSWQSSTDYQWYASRANDGNTSNVQTMLHNSCSHTNGTGQNTTWWQVDLGQSYDISHILLTTRNWTFGPDRLAGFSIYVSNTNKSSWVPSELCFHDSTPHEQAAFRRRIDCTNSMNGRYIVVFNKRPVTDGFQGFRYSTEAILELCEVNVQIELGNCVNTGCTTCRVGWYGARCEHSCANCGGSQGCNKQTGICLEESCRNGYFGVKCTSECPMNCLNNMCNFIYGNCYSCKDPYFGANCRQRCPNNCISCTSFSTCSSCSNRWYGPSCSSNCSNCGGNGNCQKNDGQCISQSCTTGFYGSHCSLACSFHCIGNECEFLTGMCTNCSNGKYGVYCEKDCPYSCSTCKDNTNCYICKKGFYGPTCNQTCTGCGGNGFCRQSDGVCNSSSCLPKYYGSSGKCDQNCPPKCGGDGSCNFQNGICSDGCMSGYMGERCNQLCSQNCADDKSCKKYDGECKYGCNNGWFGLQCNKTCPDNCGDGACHRMNGACSGECAKTFYGSDCSTKCPKNCGGDGVCDRNGGTCSDRCKPGWNGTNCDLECKFPKFGADCTEDCGYCRNNSCNHINGTCIQGCEDGWMSTQCDIRASKSDDDHSNKANTGVIGGAVGAVVILVIVVVLVVIVLRRRSQGISKGRGLSENNAYMNSLVQEQVSTQNVIYTNVMSVEEEKRASKPKILIPKPVSTQYEPPKNACESERTYYNSVDIKMGIDVKELKAYVTEKLSSNKYEEEFKGIPYGAIHPTTEAELPKNMKKNRFKTTFPYDHSRVVLKGKTDYINANFIEDTDGIKRYIATQGPIPNTIEDFWQMVWEYNIGIIVMLTNLQEGKKKKCEQYWPNPNEKMTQGQFGLSLLDERQFSYYVLRELEVHDLKSKQKRKIQQYHFTTWPDHGTPDPLSLVLFHKRVSSTEPKYDGPTLVHCSAGIGRTGTFIALDALENQGKKYGKVDIENHVRIMRKDRMNMIQTSEQYKVLHEALIETFQWNDTSISMGDFPSVWQKIESDKGPLNQQSLKKEYDMLREMKSDQENPVSALRGENKSKSRTDSILPLDKHRPYLSSYFPGGNDFINSVMIPSHISKDAFLVTQVPLPGTVVDFWRMIVDHDSRSIVYFSSPSDDGTNFYPSDEDTVETEMHIITKESSNILQERVEETKIQVKNKKSSQTKDVVMLKIDIADNNYPSGAQIFRAAEVVELQRNRNKYCPCTVVALDGCTPCEVFCAISNILEYMKVDNRIDVFQTARQLQIRRPEFFGTFETYRYCYQIINEYLITQSVYFNM